MTDHRISAAAMDAVIAMDGVDFRLAMALRHQSRIDLHNARRKLAAAVAALDAALAEPPLGALDAI